MPELFRAFLVRLPTIGVKAPAALIINGSAALASFLSTIILARIAGAAEIGHYAFGLTTGTMLAVLALMGLDRILVRVVAGDLREGLAAEAHGRLLQIRRIITRSSLFILATYLLLLSLGILPPRFELDQKALFAGGGAIMSVAFLRLGLSALRGTGHWFHAQLLEGLPSYAFSLALLALLIAGRSVTGDLAVILFVSFQIVAAYLAWRAMSATARQWPPPVIDTKSRPWVAGLPLMGVVFVHTAADWLIMTVLGTSDSAVEVGAYRVIVQIALVPAIVIGTAETYYSPLFAGDFRSGRPDLAWSRQRRANRLLTLGMVPFLLLTALFATPLLGVLFGPEFEAAALPLRIMLAGQLVNVITGPVGGMVAMYGGERILLLLALTGLGVLLLLSLLLIPYLGLTGAAIAWAANIAIRTGGTWIAARRYIRPR